jgi:hypothetical protein
LEAFVDQALCPNSDDSDSNSPAVPLQFTYLWTVSLSNVTLVGNSAASPSSAGGGLFIGPGGNVSLSNTTITNNQATLFGGGVAAGGQEDATCSLWVGNGTRFSGNSAGHGGAHVYTTCQGSLSLTQTAMQLSIGGSQVREPPATRV